MPKTLYLGAGVCVSRLAIGQRSVVGPSVDQVHAAYSYRDHNVCIHLRTGAFCEGETKRRKLVLAPCGVIS